VWCGLLVFSIEWWTSSLSTLWLFICTALSPKLLIVRPGGLLVCRTGMPIRLLFTNTVYPF
jgi:uncharacterized membrane protein YccC